MYKWFLFKWWDWSKSVNICVLLRCINEGSLYIKDDNGLWARTLLKTAFDRCSQLEKEYCLLRIDGLCNLVFAKKIEDFLWEDRRRQNKELFEQIPDTAIQELLLSVNTRNQKGRR